MLRKLTLLIMLLLVANFYVTPANSAQPKSKRVAVEVVKTEDGLRVLFKGDKNNFTFNFADDLIFLRFPQNSVFGDLTDVTKYKGFVKKVEVQKNRISLKLVDTKFKVTKFKIANKAGIEITPQVELDEPEPIEKNPEAPKVEERHVHSDSEFLDIGFAEAGDKSTLTFKWKEDVGAASYIRDQRLWVVFDKGARNKDLTMQSKWFSKPTREPSEQQYFIFSIILNEVDQKIPNAIMYRTGFEWNLEISNKSIKSKDMRVLSRPLAAPHPRVDIELDEEARNAVRFRDSYVGDELVALPFIDSAAAINDKFTFIDFKILKSVQGGILIPTSDTVKIARNNKNFEISSAAGLNIAPRVYKKHEARFEDPKYGFKMDDFVEDFQSILSLKSYKVDDDKFVEKVRKLRMHVIKAPNSEQKAKIYANWALFYLANGFYEEGRAMLKLLRKEDMEFGNSYNIKIIEAALNYMDYEYMTAYNIARSIQILEVPISLRKEVRFWQALTSYMVAGSNDYQNKADPLTVYLERDGTFLSEYTDPFIMEISISIIQDKIHTRQYTEAQPVLKDLLKMKVGKHDQNRINEVAATYYAALDSPDKALEYWDKCIGDLEDTLHRSACRYAKANYQEQTSRITLIDYTEELEKLTTVWRGDELEINALTSLGDAYLKMKEYAKALRSWDTIVKYYPFSPDSLKLGRKMGDTFVKFFTEHKDEQVSHLKALAVFYEFEHLVPIGELGDEVVIRFAEHLYALDLLDQAAAILQHQVTNRLKGNKKEKAINMLAKIYLLNDDPSKALLTINSGDEYSELPNELVEERRYIHAMALHENDQDAEALELLKTDLSQNADDIKAVIYWASRKWQDFNNFVEPRIYAIREDDSVLEKKDTDRVLKLSISYLISGEYGLLDDLLRDFTPRMPQGERDTRILDTISKSWATIKARKLETQQTIDLIKQTVNQIIEVINTAEKDAKK